MTKKIQISSGLTENGIIIGNAYDKYGSKNPIVKRIMKGFHSTIDQFITQSSPTDIHEIGCGEGALTLNWSQQGIKARGSDFSKQVIEIARSNARKQNLSHTIFKPLSIYDLKAEEDNADLVVCCEVLEHIESPEAALESLQKVVQNHLIISVPREPIWRILNLLRGKYILKLGNTPGHIQHWSRKSFISLVSGYFTIIEAQHPLPWTILLCKKKAEFQAPSQQKEDS